MKIKSVEHCVELFKKYAQMHGDCSLNGDYKKGNKACDGIFQCIDYLKANDTILDLKELYNDENISIRIWAAYATLHYDSESINVLDTISKSNYGFFSTSAKLTIEEYNKGNI